MRISIILIISMITGILGISIIFNVTSNIHKINEDLKDYNLENYTDSNSYFIISGEFKVKNKCFMDYYKGSELNNSIETKLSNTMSYRFNISGVSNYNFKVKCCNIKNVCINETFG